MAKYLDERTAIDEINKALEASKAQVQAPGVLDRLKAVIRPQVGGQPTGQPGVVKKQVLPPKGVQ